MKLKKVGVLAASALMALSLGLFGCSSQAASSSASSSAADTTEEIILLNEGELTIVSSPDYPPFENLVAEGETVGYEIDLFQAIADKMGLTLNVVPMQFDAIIPAIVAGGQGDVGVSGFSVDPERAKEIDFTTSFYVDDQAVAVMDGSAITEANAEEALNSADVTIAVQTGTTGETFAQENFPNANIQGYGNSTDCFAAVQSGQADAVCTNLAVVADMTTEAYPDFTIVYRVATGEEYAAVVSKDNPALLAALDEAIAELEADGTLDDLKAKWFNV